MKEIAMKDNIFKSLLTILAVVLCALSASEAAVGYLDPLDGGDVTLTGTAPEDRGGTGSADWTANSDGVFRANGNVDGGVGADGVFLPFTPTSGYIYTLSADVNTTSGNGNTARFITLGFAQSNGNDQFGDPAVTGYGTMLVRENRGAAQGRSFPGSRAIGDYTNFETTAGAQELRIVLDAQDGISTNWTMAFYSDNGSGMTLRNGPTKVDNGDYGDIRYVGFTRLDGDGTVSNFELSVIPEPASLWMVGLGMAALMGRRRLRRR
jgi:hypothetical protein